VHAHVGFHRIGQVAAEGAVRGLVVHQFALLGEGQFAEVVERLDVGGLNAGGLPLGGIETVAAPQLGHHLLQLVHLQRRQLLAGQGFRRFVEIAHVHFSSFISSARASRPGSAIRQRHSTVVR
jgi:hypothetical protein